MIFAKSIAAANAAPLEDEAGKRAFAARVKLVVCAVLMAVLALGLTSCNYLEKIKHQRAEVQADGSVVFNGHTYTKVRTMTDTDGIISVFDERPIFNDGEIPLLLVPEMGTYAEITSDGKLIWSGGWLYTRDDMSADEIAELDNPKLDRFCTQVWYWGSQFVFLDEPLEAAIEATLAGEPHEGMPSEDESITGWNDYYVSQEIYRTDAKMHFRSGYFSTSSYDNGRVFVMDWGNYVYYEAPEQYRAVLADFAESGLGDDMPMPVAMMER